MKNFADRLASAVELKNTPCIVGLDPTIDKMPLPFLAEQGFSVERLSRATIAERANLLFEYNRVVLANIHDLVPAVKPQSAYYERYGSAGILALERTIALARHYGLLVILDAKRGDIGPTSEAYAQAYLSSPHDSPVACDCLTLAPYLGEDSLEPFFKTCLTAGTGVFVCVKTSNPGAIFQDIPTGGKPLYEAVAEMIAPWVERGRGSSGLSCIGIVVGASHSGPAAVLRELLPSAYFLVPGFGAQGGSTAGVRASFLPDGSGAVVNSSRAILYPHLYGDKDLDVATAVRRAALDFVGQVKEMCLKALV